MSTKAAVRKTARYGTMAPRTEERRKALSLLETVLPKGAVSTVGRTFDLMEVAERVITDFESRFPAQKALIHTTFKVLCPNELVRYGDDVYRAHCRELITRVIRGERTQDATAVELLCGMSEASLIAPPKRTYAALMRQLFLEIFPEKKEIAGSADPEEYAGAIAELRAELSRKMVQEDRVLS